MTASALPRIFLPSPGPLEHDICASREILFSSPGFLNFFESVGHPTALLSTSYKLVMANGHLVRMLGLDSEEELVGAALGQMNPGPDADCLPVSSQYLEIQCKGFFVLTIGLDTNSSVTPLFGGP